ncbi:MAG: CidA/LrgA family protein [Desulfuromonas sp.]|nr:MAG: CidA/LrgA family protein [Desulfuromonas sp.]
MVRGFAILVGLQLLGTLLVEKAGLPVPGNVVGMLLLFAALRLRWVQVEWVRDAAQLLLSHMALLFVPAGVGVMVYSDLIVAEWLPIVVATLLSTFVVMAVTGWTAVLLDRKAAVEHE